jgi:hypothetical protein
MHAYNISHPAFSDSSFIARDISYPVLLQLRINRGALKMSDVDRIRSRMKNILSGFLFFLNILIYLSFSAAMVAVGLNIAFSKGNAMEYPETIETLTVASGILLVGTVFSFIVLVFVKFFTSARLD